MSQLSPAAMNTRIVISVLIALLFTILPLPGAVSDIRPMFVPLVVLYWATFHPLSFGLGKAFLTGILLEATQSLVIGQAALGIVTITVFALANHRRMQFQAIPQQMLTIAALLFAYQFIQVWVESVLDRPSDLSARTLAVITSAFIWPGIIVFMRSIILRKKLSRR